MNEPPPGPVVDIEIACEHWRTAVPDTKEQCRRVAVAALGAARERWPVPEPHRLEVSLLLADDAAIRPLNRDWRGVDKATNVLSFPAEPETTPPGAPAPLGDVVIAYETVAREAAEAERTIPQHLAHMIVHGVLHLLGHDHEEDQDAVVMERLEVAVLAALGVPDPYREEQGDDEQRPLRQ